MGTRHPPSHARALVQEAKKAGGRPPEALLAEARTIGDAGHAAEAIVRIVAATELPAPKRAAAAKEALALAMTVERTWRRVEVFGTILESVDHPDVEKAILDAAADVPPGEGRSSALAILTPHVSREGLGALFHLAAQNGAQAGEDAKAVLRIWTRLGHAQTVLAAIQEVPDAALRARLFAFVAHRKPDWADLTDGGLAARATEAVLSIEDIHAATESWRTLFQQAENRAAVDALRAGLEHADEAVRVALTSTVVGRLYKDRRDEEAAAVGDAALKTLDALPDDMARLRLCQNLVRAYTRAKDVERAQAALSQAEQVLASMDEEVAAKLRIKLAQAAGHEPASKPAAPRAKPRDAKHVQIPQIEPLDEPAQQSAEHAAPASGAATAPPTEAAGSRPTKAAGSRPTGPPARGFAEPRRDAADTARPKAGARHALALHATYDGGMSRAHLQAVARAAPLCDGFDLDLVLFGFPFDDIDSLVKAVATETNIGGGGKHIQHLAEGGHVTLVRCPDGALPPDDGTLGRFVATTPRPMEGHQRTLNDAKSAATGDASNGRICVIMGLGRSGLPRGWLEGIPFHYEITGRDVSLETATAMGILADRLRALGPPA